MGDESGVLGAEPVGTNGNSPNGAVRPSAGKDTKKSAAGTAAGLLGRIARGAGGMLAGRLTADLDERDPDYIREKLPLFWLMASLWFRGEVRGMHNV
ncbi:MAG: hypothetical protein ABR536_05115, partial [Solirubrobacterales bacterium]